MQHSHSLWHATGIAFPPADVHRGTGRGPGGKAGPVLAKCTHTFYPVKHLLLQFISRARHSTRNSWTATECKGMNPCPALTGTSHCKVPPSPSKGSHALHILYSAELGGLSRFLQTKKQVRSEVLHCKRFYIYTESTSLVLALKLQVKSQPGSFFSPSSATAGLRRF